MFFCLPLLGRAFGALITAFILVFFLIPPFARWIKKKGGQPIRLDGPETHLSSKQNTPTMGGTLIVGGLALCAVLWTSFNPYVGLVLFVTVGLGLLGALDDFLKISRQNSKGLPAKTKLYGQLAIGASSTLCLHYLYPTALQGKVLLPFFQEALVLMPFLFIAFGALVIVGASNAVNLTDGLDGLAIGPFMTCAATLALSVLLKPDLISAIPEASELMILCSAAVGAGLAFLWYNAPPAKIFMGDVGALSLGGFLGVTSLALRQESLLVFSGGLFVAEALSVIIQVAVFKKTGKRVFLMSPLHHHFEKKGWKETTLVIRFWILSLLMGLFTLSLLPWLPS